MLFKFGRGYLRSRPAVLRGINLYIGLFMRAGVLMSILSPTVKAADLPVPCGGGACAAGGGPSVWVSAGSVQAPTVTGNTMHINQESEKAILNWSSFNIGAGAGVDFKQPDTSAVALNRIFQGDPSKILGALHANGQVYLINQNGFLFGDGATVNVHGLVASTLDVDTNLFKSSGIAQAINQATPAAAFQSNGKMGDINIAQGAVIKTDDGGQVMIFAPNITNDGEIDTPKGQTILAASKDKVYLKINSSNDPGLRGFLVEVNDGGTVTNGGKISVGEGNATLEGLTVNQDGMVSADTSVQLNGSIRLLARDQVNNTQLTAYSQGSISQITTHTGTVNFGPGSVTQVVPDASDTSTTVDDQAQLPSTVDVMAKTIDMKGDSKILVPGGQVDLTAAASPQDVGNQASIPPNDSRILMEAQSLIDVSGTTSTVLPMSRNTVQLQLRGNELADSPLQRNGALYGQTVTVDVRKGTPLANVSGAIKGIQRTVSERLSAGGSVSASSEGDVVVAKGATVNFSGGQVTYQGGYLNTSKLLAKNGTVVDIGNADPNQTYIAVLGTYQQNHPTWGVSRTYFLPGINSGSAYTPGYVQGMDAGTFSVNAPGVLLAGQLQGGANVGELQRLAPGPLPSGTPAWDRSYDQVPFGGQLIIGDPTQVGANTPNFETPSVTFKNSVAPASNPDASLVGQPLQLSADLFANSGITRAAIYSNGAITIPKDVTLDMAPGGTLALTAGTSSASLDPSASIPPALEIDGKINIPGGQVTLSSANTNKKITTDSQKYLAIVLGQGSQIDTAGMWVNDTNVLNPGGATGPAVIDGGAVTVTTNGDLTMSAGSLIDVSGGAQVLADGSVKAGVGGDVTLASNGDFLTNLTLNGSLRSDALYQGGTLSLTADGIEIGTDKANQARPGMLTLDPAMFQNDGFSNYDLAATHLGLSVAGDTTVNLIQQNRVLDPGYKNQATGANMADFSQLKRLPLPQRQPVNLALQSTRQGQIQDPNVGITVAQGAVIQTDPEAQVSLTSDRMITIDGAIDVPAGTIDVTLQQGLSNDGFYADKAIWLSAGARLAAPAYVMLVPNDLGLKQGQVLDAGTISLQAQEGQIVTAAGSAIDVSGAHQILSALSDTGDRSSYVSSDVAGAAGTIQLTAADGMFLDGSMYAKAAPVAGAAGGTLSVTLDSTAKPIVSSSLGASGYYSPRGPRVIQVSADDQPQLPAGAKPGDSLLSQSQLNQLHSTQANSVTTVAHLSAVTINQGGFDSINLKVAPVLNQTQLWPDSSAAIDFNGNVSINVGQRITLDSPVLSTTDGQVDLSAPYVAIGPSDVFGLNRSIVRLTGTPSAGNGALSVKADFIDLIGDTALQGFGSAASPAAQLQATHDIRLQGTRLAGSREINGSFQAAADIQMQAGQIYPSTLTDFSIEITNDPTGTIRFAGSGTATSAPLSAAGQLNVSAPNIVQDGILRAPFGHIQLDGGQSVQLQAGSVTSVSGAGLTVPFGQTQFGQDWIIPYQNVPGETAPLLSVVSQQQGQPYDMALPDKQVTLNAPSVSFDKGATIDVSGGGDLYAYEFVPGPGGSQDVLLPANDNGAFAVVPDLGSMYAPVDPVISSQGLQPGDTIYLSGGNGLAAGEYAMLPARYALLPGAFLVTPVAGTAGMTPGRVYPQLSGIPIVAGRAGVAGTDIQASLWSGYAVENGAQVRQRAQYTESYANTFFATDANGDPTNILLPQDAGAVAIAAGQDLTLSGHLDGQSPNGRGAQLDIVAQQLDVVAQHSDTAAGVQILAGDLNDLGASSVLLGGQRTVTDGGVAIQAQAQSVQIDGDVTLTLPELMLVAGGQDTNGNPQVGQVTVASGATLKGSGGSGTDEGTLILNGDSVLLRIASGAQPALQRTNVPSSPSSKLTVASGARLVAGTVDGSGNLQGGSLILDSAGSAQSQGDIQVGSGGSLRLGASRISLGDVGNLSGDQGLVLSNAALAKLDVANMSLISGSAIELYGAATVSAKTLYLQAQSIDGYSNDGQTAVLQADTLNIAGAAVGQASAGTGTGSLTLNAQQVNLGAGGAPDTGTPEVLAIGGFNQVNVNTGELTIQGSGRLNIAGSADIGAGWISGGASSDWTVATPGVLSVTGSGQAPAVPTSPALGASLTLQGEQLFFDTAVVMPTGQLTLAATGDNANDSVVLGSDASIVLSGQVVDFSGTAVASPGGQATLTSANGDVQIQSGATVNVAGGNADSGGGAITIQAANGQVAIAGNLVANRRPGGDGQGGFTLDAGSIGDFSNLTGVLAQGGFTGTVSVRARTGDLQVASGDTIKAHTVTLTADEGSIDIFGVIDASGAQAGSVSLNAGNDLSLNGTGRIDAHATGTNAKGGSVFLGASVGNLTFAKGAVIDVTGTQQADIQIQQGSQTITRTGTGLVQFRLARGSLAGSDLSGAVDGIKGAGSIVVEADQVYDVAGDTLGSGAVAANAGNPYYQDAATFMQNAPSIMAGLGLAGDANAQLRPGVVLQAPGSLTLTAPMDLSQWRFGPQAAPGVLTIRAGGDLTLAKNLSDGFTSGTDYLGDPMDVLRSDDSWSLRLVAGADLSSADPLAVSAGAGSLTIGNNVTVRTGTGSIDMAAGGNLILGNGNSVVYTAGIDGGMGTFDPVFASFFLNGQFPVGGGDLRIAADGDIVAHSSGQLINDWLPRLGGAGILGDLPTTWAINFANFAQGVGALGGGNVTVSAGGDINNLSVVMPTIGTQVGQAQYDESGSGATSVITNQVAVSGGTQLDVSAGGDILGGVFYAGQGQGDIRAGGAVGPSQQTSLDPILALGDGRFNVTASGDLALETVVNPTILPQSPTQSLGGASTLSSYFFTYGPKSAVNLTSLSGNVSFSNDNNRLSQVFGTSSMWTVYPGTLTVAALQGDIDIGQNDFTLFPSPQGQLQLLAEGSVLAADNQAPKINVSDADPGTMPSVSQPVDDVSDQSIVVRSLSPTASAQYNHAPVPVHTGDTTPVLIVARDGSIGTTAASAGYMALYLPKPFKLVAGQDVRNTAVFGQNLSPNDVSLVQAGRDVVFSSQRNGNGALTGNNQVEFRIGGPGQLDIIAGRNVDLGTSVGVTSVGNTQNPALPSTGASILVMTGVGQTPDYSAFIQKYLADSNEYQDQLTQFLSQYPSSDSSLSNIDRFKALPLDVQRRFILQVLFSELKASGIAEAKSQNKKDYLRGFDAIKTLFPGSLDNTSSGPTGNLDMLLSRIATLDGGDIRLVVPSGLINAGTADTSAISKDTSQLGIVVQGSGNIESYLRGNFNVNQSRVFTLDGGNILVWSSLGDIDAGRGAKTAIAAPPPIVTVDPKTGSVSLQFPPAIAGSGIRAAVTTPGKSPGSVYLFAPGGVVNTGDAGIGSQGGLVIAANGVVGHNITVAGPTLGWSPTTPVSIAAGLTGLSNASSSVSKSASNTVNSMTSNAVSNTPLADAALSYLKVVVISLGNLNMDQGQ